MLLIPCNDDKFLYSSWLTDNKVHLTLSYAAALQDDQQKAEILAQSAFCLCLVNQIKALADIHINSCTTCGKAVHLKESFVGSAINLKWVRSKYIHKSGIRCFLIYKLIFTFHVLDDVFKYKLLALKRPVMVFIC